MTYPPAALPTCLQFFFSIASRCANISSTCAVSKQYRCCCNRWWRWHPPTHSLLLHPLALQGYPNSTGALPGSAGQGAGPLPLVETTTGKLGGCVRREAHAPDITCQALQQWKDVAQAIIAELASHATCVACRRVPSISPALA
jgi:hypothetical protein